MNAHHNPSAPGGPAPARLARRFGAFRYSAIELLGSLVVLIVTSPFLEDFAGGDLVEAVLVTMVMVLAVLAVGGRRRVLTLALLLVTPTLVAKWGNHVWPHAVRPEIYLAASAVFFLFVIGHLLRFILRAPRVDANVLCAGISGYLLLGLLWVPAYLLVARATPTPPGAFAIGAPPGSDGVMRGFNSFYFSFITLTTVGYGDITPVSKVARMLSVLEAITGVFYVAVLISRLVAVYSSAQPPTPDDHDRKA
jgi:hypothetical protein